MNECELVSVEKDKLNILRHMVSNGKKLTLETILDETYARYIELQYHGAIHLSDVS